MPIAKFSPHQRNLFAPLSFPKPPILHQTNSPVSALGENFLALTCILLGFKIPHFPSCYLHFKFFEFFTYWSVPHALIWVLPFLSQNFYFSSFFQILCYPPNNVFWKFETRSNHLSIWLFWDQSIGGWFIDLNDLDFSLLDRKQPQSHPKYQNQTTDTGNNPQNPQKKSWSEDQNSQAKIHSNASSSSPRATIRKNGEDPAKYYSQITIDVELIRVAKKYQLYDMTFDYLHQNMSVWSKHPSFTWFYQLSFRLGLRFHIP